jgi:hypothetical protein
MLLPLAGFLFACGSSSTSNNSSADAGADGAAQGNNVAPAVVDRGPKGLQSVNVLYTTVTLCKPGTTTCQTIDHIEVDTGSTGLRIVSSVLDPTLMLPAQTASNGNPVVECYQYSDGFNWGPVLTADVQIGGETASAVPIQIAGGAASTPVPADCSSAGSEEDTVSAFGGNGLIGLGFQTADCGSACESTTAPRKGAYYSCAGTTCTAASVPAANQVQNPVALFPTDNNGVAITLPAIDPGGQATVTGSLIFGIGTQSNNGLGSAQILTLDTSGQFTTVYNGQTLGASFIDSGSLAYGFPDSSIPQGSGNLTGFYCPTSTLNLTATSTGQNKIGIATPFVVGNASTLYVNGDAALNDLAITAFTPNYFDWGLPFFYGRTVFTAISGASTPGGTGPYFAY